MQAANKVALNTGILYGRMLFTMAISLYATRLVLNALGSTDYGIFNLVAGVIAMLSFLNAAMTTSTQRFLSYYQGKMDREMQRKVFANSLLLHIAIGLFLVLVLELCGLFLFDGFLNIPLDRIAEAKTIYHFMSATVFFTVVAVPFNGSLIAHENMLWIAIVNILETLLKLAIAIALLHISKDKLTMYGLLTAGVSVISFLLYAFYCFKKYDECTVSGLTKVDRPLLKELTSFAGWNLFGSLCGVGRSQGLAILLNIFLGTIANAAYGIANQVASQLSFFSATMLRALNPQIMKSEGQGDRDRMLRLSLIASKFGFFLLAIFAIPCIFEMPVILKLWLKNVPESTVVFCRLILVGTLISQMTIGLQSAIQATGNIKGYQVVIGSLILLNLPVSYILLYLRLPAYTVLVSFCVIEFLACAARLYFLKVKAGMQVGQYFDRVIFKIALPTAVNIGVCMLTGRMQADALRVLVTVAVSFAAFLPAIYFAGLNEDEKEMIQRLKNSLLAKLPGSKNSFRLKNSNP